MLYTARSMEFMNPEGRAKALNTCKLLGLDWDALVHNDEFPAKKVGKRYIIPIVPLARWMVTW